MGLRALLILGIIGCSGRPPRTRLSSGKYQQSLALNPDDTLSKQELEYIKHLRATQS